MPRLFSIAIAFALPLSAAPHTAIKAEHYEALKSLLIPGDRVYAFAIRNPAPGERPGQDRPIKTLWDEQKFARRVALLDAVHDTRLEKAIVLSSVLDLKANLERCPKDAGWIMYNSEPGYTPGEELADIEGAVREFARIVHAAGRKMEWAPTGAMISQNEPKLLAMAGLVDSIELQHQRVLQNDGVETFVSLTRKRAEAIGKTNPKCLVGVQVVLGRGTPEQLIEALRGVAEFVNSGDIWTMQDTAGVAGILQALRR
jgi:hypothetical protein